MIYTHDAIRAHLLSPQPRAAYTTGDVVYTNNEPAMCLDNDDGFFAELAELVKPITIIPGEPGVILTVLPTGEVKRGRGRPRKAVVPFFCGTTATLEEEEGQEEPNVVVCPSCHGRGGDCIHCCNGSVLQNADDFLADLNA